MFLRMVSLSVSMIVNQGFPTIILGLSCLFLLPGRPESTHFLTPAERKLALDRINRGTSSDIGAVVNYGMSVYSAHVIPLLKAWVDHVVAAFLDWRVCSQPMCAITKN